MIDEIGIPCPNGDTDRLQTAIDIWTRASNNDSPNSLISSAIQHLNDIIAAESIFAIEDAEEFDQLTSELRQACSALATTCTEHKQSIGDARAEILGILEALMTELGITVAISVLAAFVSFGASAIAGSANAVRATKAAARLIRPIVEALRAKVLMKLPTERVGGEVARITERATFLLGKKKRRPGEPEPPPHRPEPTSVPKHLEPTDLTVDRKQVEKKFKHAEAFGIETPKGSAGFDEFAQALKDFSSNPSTQHLDGVYRGDPCIINVDPISKLVVVQRLDGSFLSGWKLGEDQLASVLTNGRLF
ncbi:colicin D domain-containing protein [Rhodococcus sp. G-MC3]|uniref:colicin D domain-containing protein n=1 Tax=Rhodococcus sp. G-MC3 TaxID=3046209 RepID=UPI0024BB226A|nr:colicin D domain-containing protein [Rhodococcus sp. G-MC3]MDJ0395022.1 colicin D domain-containing protein [Rhodococcus sp. G-MC3]